ncbi:hypothetical protein [Companilactobacillus versmoldensis]|uniref:Uncharacterized protein n=1 Tax=Companilactobacillus versmoldensis DSM 14857 = KCTC 3814 TaxID=1423815 RepID=A0A0R1SCQ3_9LACO|nr:hypothetical protein [Companilactobacillus versmoldensis]KRL66780.1 hypothetical protein FC27_GL000385 [Companilactobacillus versmoldensis DSM 14857 = KCTC 3814]
MKESEFFKVTEVNNLDDDIQMDPYMAMNFEFTFGVVETNQRYQSYLTEYNRVDDARFKGLVESATTVPLSSLNVDQAFGDQRISFKDQATLDNFSDNIKQIQSSDYDAQTKYIGEKLMVAIVEGLPRNAHDDFLKTQNGMAQQNIDKVYAVHGIGTKSFYFDDLDLAVDVADEMYKKACQKINANGPQLDVEPDILMNYTSCIVTYQLGEKGVYQGTTPIYQMTPTKKPSSIAK